MRSAQRLAGSLLAAVQSNAALRETVDHESVREYVTNVAKIAAGFAAFAGSDENAVALVESLRNGTTVELAYPLAGTDPEPKSVTIAPPTGPMEWHDVRMCLMLARDALTGFGVLRPSGEQVQASLLGGEVPVPGIRVVAFKGVLRMRADGSNWGRIASERYQRAPVSRLL
jgi:hypothetical protein